MGLRFLANGALLGDTLLDALQTRDASRLRRYREYLDIYEGKHWLSTSGRRGGRSTLTLNYARAVVDKGVSYLLGRGLNFAVPADASTGSGRDIATDSAERAERCLYDVYQDNNLDAVDMAAALNAGLLGDAVFKIFYDTGSGESVWSTSIRWPSSHAGRVMTWARSGGLISLTACRPTRWSGCMGAAR